MRTVTVAIGLVILAGWTTARAAVRDLSAQALAPGVLGLRWEINDKPQSLRLERRTSDGGPFAAVATYPGDRREGIDRFSAAADQVIEYRLVQIGDDGKELGSRQALGRNSAELVMDGGFERAGRPEDVVDMQITASGPWTASIVEGGLPPGRKCLQFATSDPAARPTFSAGSRWYAVTPATRYQFSWWTTESPDHASAGEGQAYGMTRQRTKSYYEKTASLYVEKVSRQGEWTASWCEPRLPRDVRFVYFTLKGSGQGHNRPVRFDNVSIVDTDMALLLETDIVRLIESTIEQAEKHPDLELASQAQELAQTIRQKLSAVQSPELQEVDACLDTRAELCAALRQMKELGMVLRLADLKAAAGAASNPEMGPSR